MQNPYTADIGDYGKYMLLNALAGSDLRLAVVWYLNPNVAESGDGKFTSDLSEAKEKDYRFASPNIYDALRKIVRNGVRQVSRIKKEGILPANTIFSEAPLRYLEFRSAVERKKAREDWLLGALNETKEAVLVFVDPDNGLEVKSHARHSKLGAKYAFENEIRAFWERNQSILVYQNVNRSGSVDQQAQRGFARLSALTGGGECWAIGFHSYSARLYFVLPSKNHVLDLRGRTRQLVCGSCKIVLGAKLYE
jgi:hypothetical protein